MSKSGLMILALLVLPTARGELTRQEGKENFYNLVSGPADKFVKGEISQDNFYTQLTDDVVDFLKPANSNIRRGLSSRVFPVVYKLTV